jgi:hypothetical protein
LLPTLGGPDDIPGISYWQYWLNGKAPTTAYETLQIAANQHSEPGYPSTCTLVVMSEYVRQHPRHSDIAQLAAVKGHDAGVPSNTDPPDQSPSNSSGNNPDKLSSTASEKDVEKGATEGSISTEEEAEELAEPDSNIVFWVSTLPYGYQIVDFTDLCHHLKG